ncbi:MAG TPA: EAL domain-containing protein [Burkholderiales bacterium]|nr:EAL domain-containing protein [Burkholderiales bacterium]
MKPEKSLFAGEANEELAALIATLHATEQRLEELTAGEVDTVADRDGRTLLLGQAQEQLRHIEAAKQAAVLNALPAHVALLDAQGLIISVNEAWRQFAGANVIQRPGYAIGLNYLAICDSARREGSSEAHQVAEGIRSVLSGTARSFSIEYACHSPTEQRWLLLTVTPMGGGPPSGAVVTHLNVTQQKLAAEAVRQSEKRLRDLIDGLGPSMFVGLMTPQGILIEANRPALAAAGLKPQDVLGKPFEETYWWSYSREVQQQLREAITRAAHGEASRYDVRVRAAENQLIDADFSLQPLRDETGKVVFLVPSASVITERKEAEARIVYLNRVYAMLSGINALVARERGRDKLFTEACRIAVEAGGFRMSLLSIVNRNARTIVPVASAGKDEELLAAIKGILSSGEDASNTMVARAIREKKAVVANDSQGDPRVVFGRKYAESGVRSMAVLPLIVSDEAVGALALYAGEREFFHEEEMKLLTDLTRDIAFALEHIGKEEKIARLSRIQAVMSGINAVIVRVRDRLALFNEACRIAVEHGNFGLAWIGDFDPGTQDVTPIAWAGESTEELTRAKSSASGDSPRGKGAVGQAIRERRPVFNNDITADSIGGPRLKEILRLGFRSQVTLPLFEGQTIVATLTMYAREPNFFDEEELRLLTELAGNISFAIENISRQCNLDKLARIRAISGEINAAIIRIRERKALLEECCRIVSERGKFEMVWIGAIDHDAQQVLPVAWTGFSEESAHAVSWASIANAKGTLGEAMQTRKASVRNDIEGELPGGKLRHEALKRGCRSSLSLPLVVDGKVTALVILFATGRGFFDKDELALLDEVASDISFALQGIEKQKKLDYLSYYDVLTGLANRTLFIERVAQYMRSAANGGHKLALFLIDLERFKNINDSLGQPAGDALLIQVAEWLTRNVGDANLLARVGADHFAMVLPEARPGGDVARLVERTMEAFLEHPFRLNDAVFRIAAKVGVALFPDDGADADTLFRNAEAALKKAKARGDRYLFYIQTMTETVAGRLTLENQLRQALDNEEFVLHYQPKVNLVSGKLTGAEALIRWNDPRTGLVPPGKFIPVLEETGLIFEVGRWALHKAIADYLRWRIAGLAAVRIAVNVSPLQLRNRGFIDEIEQVIGIDANAAAGLELEITESLIMEDVKHNIASLQAIRALGVTIAIDDFGTGFSSLSYLAKLPVDTLKIDRSFVVDMTAAPEGLALVSTIINLAHSLKLKVVAEGVETEEQSRLLRLLNCDEMQGYLFSKPVPSEIFETRFLAPPPGRQA